MRRTLRSLTLLELMISIVLLSIIVLGLSSIDTFSVFQVRNADQRAKLQFEAAVALEHIAKEINRAIGNERISGANSVVDVSQQVAGDYAVHFYLDKNGNGQRDALGTDDWVAYRFTAASGNPDDRYQIWFCTDCDNRPCNNCNPPWGDDRISFRITNFNVIKPGSPLQNNFVTVNVTACWDPAAAIGACGSANNPSVTMQTIIKMPTVTTN